MRWAVVLVLVAGLAGCVTTREQSRAEEGTEALTRTTAWSSTGTIRSQTDTSGLLGLLSELGTAVGAGGLAGWGLTRIQRGPPTQKVGLPEEKVRRKGTDARQD